ncbi:hypothetical protein BGZ63DRAFT_406087 [Mariannaea sp. PMI_226]|nr:hypothetical protein BGZ63DRAFT_406087 [Mariannaea sp. PMI_226]
MRSNTLLAGALLLIGAQAGPSSPRQLNERDSCNHDNLLRCFIDTRYSVQATQYCSGLSAATATVGTTTATSNSSTTTVQAEVTVDPHTITITSTTTIFTATIPTSTTTLTLGPGTVAKRDATAVSPPHCMTNGVTYPASRITSACSCISVPASTVSVTQTVATEVVTYTETSFVTPTDAVVTTWATVATDTSVVTTVTVGPPAGTNRIVNGDFETGNSDGWELTPSDWTGTMTSVRVDPGNWAYQVNGSGNSLGSLSQVLPIWLEAGTYQFGLVTPLFPFPLPSAGWGGSTVLFISNPVTGANTTVSLNVGIKLISLPLKAYVASFKVSFTLPGSMTGYNKVSINYLTPSPYVTSIDGIYLQRTS